MPDSTGMGAEMSKCCGSGSCQATAAAVSACPVSGHKGAAVERQTVKALLTETALIRIGRTAHRFCPEAACDVVYFDAEGVCYTTCDVRVPVWHKEPFGNRIVCYCFGESEGQIRAEIATVGQSLAIERVRRHISAGRCACEVRNPRGACCLGDVTAAVKRVEAALRSEVLPA